MLQFNSNAMNLSGTMTQPYCTLRICFGDTYKILRLSSSPVDYNRSRIGSINANLCCTKNDIERALMLHSEALKNQKMASLKVSLNSVPLCKQNTAWSFIILSHTIFIAGSLPYSAHWLNSVQ